MAVAKNALGEAPFDVGSGPQEQHNTHAESVGLEEDGTLSPRRQTQGSRRVTFALWVEGTGSETDEGYTKATVTRNERSLQCMEDASVAKETWTHHLQATETATGVDRGLEQDLRQLRDKDRVQTLLSLLTRTGKGRDLTRRDVEDLLREGRDWIKNLMQSCLQEARSWKGEASWHLLKESGLREVVIKISNTKWTSVEEARHAVEEADLEWGDIGSWEDMVFRRKRSRNLQTLTAEAVLSVKVGVTLKGLLMGTCRIGQSEDSPVIHLPEEDARRTTGHSPFHTIAEWKHSQEWDEVVVRRLALLPPNGKERGRLKDILRVWKTLGATERDFLDLKGLTV